MLIYNLEMTNNILLFFVCLSGGVIWACTFHHDVKYGGIFVNCSNNNLSNVPNDLPQNTTSLNLSTNHIAVLHIQPNSSLNALKYLDVSNNKLSKLQNGTFESINSLEELFLQNNNLMLDSTTYPDDVFLPLQKLQKLHLHNNDRKSEGSYPETAFGKLRSVVELKIDTYETSTFGSGFANMTSLKRLLLGFNGCKISRVLNQTLRSFKHIPIEDLDLSSCPLAALDKMSFVYLKSLKDLNLSQSKYVSPVEAVTSMYGLNGLNLTSILFDEMYNFLNFQYGSIELRTLTKEVLDNLQGVCVEQMSMKKNKIAWIDSSILKPNSRFSNCIVHIDLSDNDFLGDRHILFQLVFAPQLVFVNITNHLRRNEFFSSMPQHNSLLSVPTFKFTFPPKLKYFYIHGTLSDMGYINGNIEIKNAVSLQSVNLAFNGWYAFQYNIYGLENLTDLDISGNYFTNMNPGFLKSFPGLRTLTMSQIGFSKYFLLHQGRQMFLPLRKLENIILSRNDLAVMDPKIFSVNQLTAIDLSFNRFESIPFDITTTPSLQHLDLRYNSLPVLSELERTLFDSLAATNNFTLNLDNNLLACGCENLGFVLWLFHTDVKLENRDAYTCVSDSGHITRPSYIYDHYDEIWRKCSGPIWLSLSVSAFALIILFMILIYLINQRKTLLLNIIYRLFGLVNVAKPPKRTDFPNDAYIGYSDCDYQYICHTMREHLEDRHGVKLFLKDRDSIPGGQIADDIINGIDSSWKTLLILSRSFLEDQWCSFTVNRVVYSSSILPAGSVVLLLYEDVRQGDISPALLNVVEERHIFCVKKYMDDQRRLWRDVSQCIMTKSEL
ncbi:toll-like receptor 4 [Haliotis rufescens]|uniref:toll-like receptor 4 n=1 Tax=Haliotis rufescens TaxID=6454 RepID=UPI00201F061E|nr:toll-like receptor 4 [Haliotis rufescens]